MKKPVFVGAGCAIITPFKGADNCETNFAKLGELIEFQISGGTDAIIICGTTGESSTMPDSEHLSVIEYAVNKVAGRIPVIAGTGSNDTAHGINLSREAVKRGADALLQVTPYYNKATQKGLIKHYSAIASAVDVPIILYNVPSRTGVNIAQMRRRAEYLVRRRRSGIADARCRRSGCYFGRFKLISARYARYGNEIQKRRRERFVGPAGFHTRTGESAVLRGQSYSGKRGAQYQGLRRRRLPSSAL